MTIVFLLAIFLWQVTSQSNICYANCKQGFCQSTAAMNCTNCDLGLININNMCIGSSYQAPPLTYLKPNNKNAITDASTNPQNCTVTNSLSRISTSMSFSPTIGKTFTRQFSIPYQHIYLQVKFNSIIAAVGTSPSNPSLLINIYTANGINIYSTVKSLAAPGNPINCTGGLLAYDVFYVSNKLASSDQSVILEVGYSGTTGVNVAMADIQLYYGNCTQQCGSCSGPTQQQCLSCRGLLTTLTNSQCSICPIGFYQNTICLPCPVVCSACTFINNVVTCSGCNNLIALSVSTSVSPLGCSSTYFSAAAATNQTFQSSQWSSTEVKGNPVTQCGFYSLIGGISIGVSGSSLTNTYYNLPAHTILYVFFDLFLIDQSIGDSNQYSISVDGQIKVVNFTIAPTSNTNLTNECGTPALEFISKQSFQFEHNASSATIRITFLKDYAGIRDVYVIANNQTSVSNCYSQLNNSCIACRNGFALLNNTCVNCSNGYYLNNSLCQVCPISCQTCQMNTNNQASCLSCSSPLTLSNGVCVDSTAALFASQMISDLQSLQTVTQWSFYPNLQNNGVDMCNTSVILGNSQIKYKFLIMNRTFTGLPAHTGVALMFDFYQIDDYANDQSVKFILNSNTTVYTPSNLKMNLCGNSSPDAVVPVYLTDTGHQGSTLTFQITTSRMGKLGINNIMLYMLNNGNGVVSPFTIQSVPTYSVTTPPIKGMTMKLVFPSAFTNTINQDSAFGFTFSPNSSRLLQQSGPYVVKNSSNNNNIELAYLVDLQSDFNNAVATAFATNPHSAYFKDSAGNQRLISQQPVTSTIPRYIDIDTQNISDRSTMQNLYNLFRGCAILALFIGLGSFLVGMSSAFDDFFILCQVIFVHVFIQLANNPPSIRIPFQGLHIVQFLQWLPWPARQSIQDGIIPNSLYQYSPLVYQQYYQDIVFARTIYQTILYFAALLIFWAVLHIILLAWNAKNPKIKYTSYFLYYYNNYDSKKLAFVDRIVRFAFFTVIWACVVQCTHFSNQPKSFNIWNSFLTILFFIAVLVYPVVVFILLKRSSETMSQGTFNKTYQELRVASSKLYYFIIRYYKLIAIACLIGFLHNSNPIIPLINLIILNLADGLFIIMAKPYGMVQQQIIQATIFYPKYPLVYHYTSIIQQFLFIILEILFLVLYGQRENSSSTTYMGIGYAICVVVIILLLNGIFRLVWGFMKYAQHCYIERQAFEQSVEKQVQQNRDPAQQHPIMQEIYKSQAAISKKDINNYSRMQSRKLSHVSQFR